jgi:hypothetical protein
MIDFYKKHKFGIFLIVPGIIAGYFYWKYVGCVSGTCPITSSWTSMVLLGALLGFFFGDSIDDFQRKRKKKKDESEV